MQRVCAYYCSLCCCGVSHPTNAALLIMKMDDLHGDVMLEGHAAVMRHAPHSMTAVEFSDGWPQPVLSSAPIRPRIVQWDLQEQHVFLVGAWREERLHQEAKQGQRAICT